VTRRAWGLPPDRDGYAADADLESRRAQAAAFWATQPEDPRVRVERTEHGGVPCVDVTPLVGPHTGDGGPLIAYFHGGGYRMGTASGWVGFATRVVLLSGARVVLVDYRLAPEHPFPAAVIDATAVYDALLDTSDRVIVGGDSAGGGLAVALGVACSLAGVPGPAAVFALSPWADMTVTAGTYESRAGSDQYFAAEAARLGAAAYLQGHDPADPLASPIFADFTGFPPSLLFVGSDEVLLDDSLGLATRMARAHASVELHAVQGMQHVWPVLSAELPESVAALDAIARFVAVRGAR
jgi:monoterpene epsilon-lactone hydrolase